MKKLSLFAAALGLALSLSTSVLAGESNTVPKPCDPSTQTCPSAPPPGGGGGTGAYDPAIVETADVFASAISAILTIVLP